MALLLDERCVILHVPKTGGTWVRAACQAAVDGEVVEVGEHHAGLIAVLAECGERNPYLATFVRDPVDWYVSAWMYWRRSGMFPRPPTYPVLEDDDFETTVRNCMDLIPTGYLTYTVETFAGRDFKGVHHIGRTESLAADLAEVLRRADVGFDPAALASVARRQHPTARRGAARRHRPRCRDPHPRGRPRPALRLPGEMT